MTEAEILARSEQAKRLLAEPLVLEAFSIIERDILEAFHSCPQRDVEGMRLLQMNLRVARQFRGILQGVIERGKLTEHDLKQKEGFLKQAMNRFR